MLLERITLHNFRGFEDLELTFHPNMTVLVGANGSGKSTILEAIATAVSTIFVKMDNLTAKSIEKNQANIKPIVTGSTKEVQEQYPVEISAVANVLNETIEWKRSLNSSKGKTTIIDAKNIIESGIGIQKRLRQGDDTLILPVISYYGTGRLWDYHREKQNNIFKSSNRINGYVDCVDGTANIKLMMKWFAQMTVQKYQNKELGLKDIPELEAVYSAMEACYKRITGNDTVKIQYSMATEEIEISYRNEKDELMRISIDQLSDGYKGTISLVADIAYRMAVLNPQLFENICTETPGIVLIDEVDLHLHPSWQHRVLGDLAAIFPKVQFIVSTHAPAVISTVKSENIIILDNGEGIEPAGEVYGRDVNTIVRNLMNATERPENIKKLFNEFNGYIDKKDVKEADRVLKDLENQVGSDDPEMAACNVKLSLLRARSR